MEPGSVAIIGGIFAIVLALSKGLEYLARYILDTNHKGRQEAAKTESEQRSALSPAERKALFDNLTATQKVCEIISTRDEDGVPLVFTPRSLVKLQSDVLQIQRDMSYALKTLSGIVERLDRKIDNVHADVERTKDEVKDQSKK